MNRVKTFSHIHQLYYSRVAFESRKANITEISINENISLDYRVKNMVAKGDNAHIELFLLFPLFFQNSSAEDTLKCAYMWVSVQKCVILNEFNLLHFNPETRRKDWN